MQGVEFCVRSSRQIKLGEPFSVELPNLVVAADENAGRYHVRAFLEPHGQMLRVGWHTHLGRSRVSIHVHYTT